MEGIVLLHGILRTRFSMARLARFLERGGYRTLNLGYPSRHHTIDVLADHIHPAVSTFAAEYEKIHFVGHSMGGLLTRTYLHRHCPRNLGRIVMLGTPNHGSEAADFLKNWWLYRRIFGPAGQQLTTSFSAEFLPNAADYDVGIIAGTRTINPISPYVFHKENDGQVSVESTKLLGMTDHIIIPVSHWHAPQSSAVHAQVLSFLKEGKFTPLFPR